MLSDAGLDVNNLLKDVDLSKIVVGKTLDRLRVLEVVCRLLLVARDQGRVLAMNAKQHQAESLEGGDEGVVLAEIKIVVLF